MWLVDFGGVLDNRNYQEEVMVEKGWQQKYSLFGELVFK